MSIKSKIEGLRRNVICAYNSFTYGAAIEKGVDSLSEREKSRVRAYLVKNSDVVNNKLVSLARGYRSFKYANNFMDEINKSQTPEDSDLFDNSLEYTISQFRILNAGVNRRKLRNYARILESLLSDSEKLEEKGRFNKEVREDYLDAAKEYKKRFSEQAVRFGDLDTGNSDYYSGLLKRVDSYLGNEVKRKEDTDSGKPIQNIPLGKPPVEEGSDVTGTKKEITQEEMRRRVDEATGRNKILSGNPDEEVFYEERNTLDRERDRVVGARGGDVVVQDKGLNSFFGKFRRAISTLLG